MVSVGQSHSLGRLLGPAGQFRVGNRCGTASRGAKAQALVPQSPGVFLVTVGCSCGPLVSYQAAGLLSNASPHLSFMLRVCAGHRPTDAAEAPLHGFIATARTSANPVSFQQPLATGLATPDRRQQTSPSRTAPSPQRCIQSHQE
ncbi:hypothetical protein NDU88_006713 [Pleurodeles waltl]|uniref:Uncharacterized protein n=1 Tax=Pleurodeles waltl TaxID=8319 RepID=A0AAV7VNI4_PLEWA|nr:hypothetical protein NDU88_006713 [Pleurodeles waltl]